MEEGGRVEEAGAGGEFAAEEAAGALIDALPDLGVELIAEVGSGEGSAGGGGVAGIATGDPPQLVGEATGEGVGEGNVDDEALGGDTTLAAVDHAAGGAGVDGEVEVGIVEDEVGIGAAEFKDGFFEGGTGTGGDDATGAGASGEGDAPDGGVVDKFEGGFVGDGDLGDGIGRQAGGNEEVDEGVGATDDVGGGFKGDGIAGNEGGGGETEELPEWEVPGHDGEEDAKRLGEGIAAKGRVGEGLRGEGGGGEFGGVAAGPCAFFDFGLALGDGFAHFIGHEVGERVGAGFEGVGDGDEPGGSLSKGGVTPAGPPGLEVVELLPGGGQGEDGVFGEEVAGGGLDGGKEWWGRRHGEEGRDGWMKVNDGWVF